MVVILKISVIFILLITYFATSLYGVAFIAGCIIGELISDRLFAPK